MFFEKTDVTDLSDPSHVLCIPHKELKDMFCQVNEQTTLDDDFLEDSTLHVGTAKVGML